MPCTDERNRARYRTVAFRMSDEERALMEKRIEVAGCLKQDYLIGAVLGQKVRIIGNEALFCRLRDLLKAVREELARLDDPSLIRDEDVRNLRVAIELIDSVEPLGDGDGPEIAPESRAARRCKLG